MGMLFSSEEKYQDLATGLKEYLNNFKTKRKIISEDTKALITSHLRNGNIQGAHSVIREALKTIDKIPLHIAVIGELGSGKSSLVNSLRGVGHEGKDAAPIGVQETTTERKPYKHPKFPNVTIWDLPGIRTTNFQLKDYLKKVKFGEYDFFIIVSAACFTKNDLDLAKGIKAMKKNFYLVRTKVDFDLQNEQEFKPTTFKKERVLEEIKNKSLKEFWKNNIEPKTFLISNKNLTVFDFPILMDTLLKDLPAEKRHTFKLSLPNITDVAIDRKRESLKKTIWQEAAKAGLLENFPMGIINGIEMEKLKASLRHYQVHFGVDDASLQCFAKDLKMPVEKLKAIIKSPYLLDTEQDQTIWEKFLKNFENFLPISLYLKKVLDLQLYFLDTVANDAKVLLKEAYSS